MPSSGSASTSVPSDPGSTSPADKSDSEKPSLVIMLKISPVNLRAFAPALVEPEPTLDDFKSALDASSPATAASPIPTPSVASPAPGGPPSPVNSEVKAVNGAIEAIKKGGKRAAPGGPRSAPRPKKQKLDGDFSSPFAPSRLGPKANQGAINAGLRALDRSGAPCKKWEKKPVALKSFTGFSFAIKAYHAEYNTKNPTGSESTVSDNASVVSADSGPGANPSTPTPMEGVESENKENKDLPNGNHINHVNNDDKDLVSTPSAINGDTMMEVKAITTLQNEDKEMNGINGTHVSTPDSMLIEATV